MTAAQVVEAQWFDGRSSQPKPVWLRLQAGKNGTALHVYAAPDDLPENPITIIPPNKIGWPAHINPHHLPARLVVNVVVDLKDAGSLEIQDAATWVAALQTAGWKPTLAQRMQRRWPVFVVMLLAAMLVVGLFQRVAAPWLAVHLVRKVPLEWELSLADKTLQQLDEDRLKPSRLPQSRQHELRSRFNALVTQIPSSLQRYPDYAPRYALSFRSGMPANAFALPGGQVVMTDALVQLAQREGLDDDALSGILAHELGHVVHRHSARKLAASSVLVLGLGFFGGDFSALFTAGGTVLSHFSYTRRHEREADCFALTLMQHAGVSTVPTANLFTVIARIQSADKTSTGKPSANPRKTPLRGLLGTHPDTLQRAAQFRQPGLPLYCK